MAEFGVGEPVLKRTVAREQDQAFAIEIKPASRIDVWNGDIIGKSAALNAGIGARAGRELAEHIKGLIEK
jgi:hypothetical protein